MSVIAIELITSAENDLVLKLAWRTQPTEWKETMMPTLSSWFINAIALTLNIKGKKVYPCKLLGFTKFTSKVKKL